MKDISGMQFNYWTVLRYEEKERWVCKCRCGKIRSVLRSSFVRGRSKSCGCWRGINCANYDEKTKSRILKYRKKDSNGCWNWTKFICKAGYGTITYRKVGGHRIHRLSWKLWKGSIPRGQYVLHSCDNRRCFNPDHLFLGNHQDNMKDMKNKGRQCKGENSHLHTKNRKKRNEIRK